MEDRETYLTNVYTPMLKNGLGLTFAKAPDPSNIDFSDVATTTSASETFQPVLLIPL